MSARELFLGGPLDGQMVYVYDRMPYIRVRVPVPVDDVNPDPMELSAPEPVEVLYARHKLRGSATTFTVWIPADWDGDVLMRHLLTKATR